MKNSKPGKALVATFLSGALAVGIWQVAKHSGSHPHAAPTPKERESTDLNALNSPNTPKPQLASALLHLSLGQKPEAFQFIKKQLADTNPVKPADFAYETEVIHALGYFNTPEAVALTRTLTHSNQPVIRMAAIEALGMRAHPDKSKALEEMIPQLNGVAEKARGWVALARIGSPELRTKAVRQEIKMLQGKDLDKHTQYYLVSQVFNQEAGDAQTKKLPEVEAYFNQLSAEVKTENEFNALAVVRGLKHFCPANRNEVFKNALSRTDLTPRVRMQMLAELVYHSGPEALAIFDSGNQDRKIASDMTARLRKQVEANKVTQPCSAAGAAAKQAKNS